VKEVPAGELFGFGCGGGGVVGGGVWGGCRGAGGNWGPLLLFKVATGPPLGQFLGNEWRNGLPAETAKGLERPVLLVPFNSPKYNTAFASTPCRQ